MRPGSRELKMSVWCITSTFVGDLLVEEQSLYLASVPGEAAVFVMNIGLVACYLNSLIHLPELSTILIEQ